METINADAIARIVRSSTAAQGKPERLEDPQTVVNSQLTAIGGEGSITLKHVSGDAIGQGYWKVSITPVDANTRFCTPSGVNMTAGNQSVFTNTTSSCSAGGFAGSPDGTALTPADYKIVVVEIRSNTVLLDRTVRVV